MPPAVVLLPNGFCTLVDIAQVHRIKLHDVRGTYATILLDSRVDLKIVSEQLGHASMTIIARIYTLRAVGNNVQAAAASSAPIFKET